MFTLLGGLCINDLVDVQNVTWEARKDWYDIGLGLHISPDDLDTIQEDHRNISRTCFREMLKVWLNNNYSSA